MPDRPDPLTDPVARALARFTPATALDRDEALFRAGRASVRTGRLWKWAVAVLLATNAVTLAVWQSAGREPALASERPSTLPAAPTRPESAFPTESEPATPSWVISARRTGELPPLVPAGTVSPSESEPLTPRSGRTGPTDL